VVGVDVVDDFVGGSCNVDLVGGVWNINLPGQVNDGVQDHLAMNVGDKESAVVEDSGGVLGDKLIKMSVSNYYPDGMPKGQCWWWLSVVRLFGTYICKTGFHQQTQKGHNGHLEGQAGQHHGC
jgi:hypothetical protein